MNVKKRDLIIFILITFAVGFLGAFTGLKLLQPKMIATQNIEVPFKEEKNQHADIEEGLQTIKQAYDLITQHYVGEVNEDELLEGAIQGMLDTLDDPYSSYMNTEAMERFNEQIQSSFQGIGAEVSMVEGKVTIIAPIKNSPAEKAGLRPNDQIIKVDDEKLEGLDLNEAVEKIRGEKGSEVVLLVQRKGSSKPIEYTLIRDDIPIETVHGELKKVDGKKTGIIDITSFSETTANEFNETLTKLEKDGMEGLIIDVRGNPGGLLDSIEEILQSFVPSDIPYLQIEDGQGKVDKFYSNLKAKKPYPINIITDEGSASASEILAVAMKEIGYDIVGTTTFGKGTVQQAVPLGNEKNGSTVKLTFYKWLSPEGNWINEVGVEPTVEQKQPEFYYTNPIQIEDTLTLDETDEQIKNAQVMLSGIGYDTKREDGYFDKQTKQAVSEFQKDNNIKVTGEIDEKTAYAIETEVIDMIRSGEKDLQLQKALEVLYK
ncbi:S41 family peptidase [Pseudogracilibacillus auburnensis]|uniref:C-terminal processing peptidase n=1 Tax=Pseudogracilibacillus auburnensis TaxID=1494959 RepID=A0A2V3W673_9BACI|nr:S41 family peptidase [Pseudogracilibacillus auburnensis]MBO1001558.1 PDZ domain-containing protein [Pseudogracilibacillus auburnensis]PXW89520.1 carboxyl-terminal processing protease [Pseudogracilibacillus auburnensis]